MRSSAFQRSYLSSLILLVVGCSQVSVPADLVAPDAASMEDTSVLDADAQETSAPDTGTFDAGPIDKAANCATIFGNSLTAPFGRLDGIVRAIVPPGHPTCAGINGTHVVVQLDVRAGDGTDTYRIVVNVASTKGPDFRSLFLPLEHSALSPWAEGWHPDVSLDYPTDLGLHSSQFAPFEAGDLVRQVTDAIPLGAKVSAYSSTSGGSSAHKVHRVGSAQDGALVVHRPPQAPLWLTFHFAEQVF